MMTFLIVLHVLVCLALMLVVLLQAGKGADMGATFGGGASQTLFGSRGAGTFLTKATAAIGAMFMLTSILIAVVSTHGSGGSVVTETPAGKSAPAMPGGAPAGTPVMPGGARAPENPGNAAPGKAAPAMPAAPASQAAPPAPTAPAGPAKK